MNLNKGHLLNYKQNFATEHFSRASYDVGLSWV